MMSLKSCEISCVAVEEEQGAFFQSPLVGRIRMLVCAGEPIHDGMIIAELNQLDVKYKLLAALNQPARVTRVLPTSLWFPLSFHEPFLWFESAVATVGKAAKPEAMSSLQGDIKIEAPMDGMFYLSPSPTEPAFVEVGKIIKSDQTVGVIEVMKCFYPVKYTGMKPAKIVQICVATATPVAHGQLLLSLQLV
jgi:biotin carboxyl carrier protein